VGEDRSTVTVRVPNALFKDWLTKHYSAVITEAMTEVKRSGVAVNFVSDSQPDATMIALAPDEAAVLEVEPASTPISPGSAGLNPRYTFDTFGRRLESVAHAVCRAGRIIPVA
jgi:chromosomal replication initiation ATPase DnaA